MREAKLRNVRIVRNEPGRGLGRVILFLLIAPQLYASVRWLFDHSYQPNHLFTAVYFLFLGAIFLVSYYFPERSFILRAFLWFCEHASFPASRKMAFFYFGLCSFVGVGILIDGQ